MTHSSQVSMDKWVWLGRYTWVSMVKLAQNKLPQSIGCGDNLAPHLKKHQPLTGGEGNHCCRTIWTIWEGKRHRRNIIPFQVQGAVEWSGRSNLVTFMVWGF